MQNHVFWVWIVFGHQTVYLACNFSMVFDRGYSFSKNQFWKCYLNCMLSYVFLCFFQNSLKNVIVTAWKTMFFCIVMFLQHSCIEIWNGSLKYVSKQHWICACFGILHFLLLFVKIIVNLYLWFSSTSHLT